MCNFMSASVAGRCNSMRQIASMTRSCRAGRSAIATCFAHRSPHTWNKHIHVGAGSGRPRMQVANSPTQVDRLPPPAVFQFDADSYIYSTHRSPHTWNMRMNVKRCAGCIPCTMRASIKLPYGPEGGLFHVNCCCMHDKVYVSSSASLPAKTK